MKVLLTAILAIAVLGLLLWHRTSYVELEKKEQVPVYRALLEDADFLAELDNSGSRGRKGIRIVAPGSGLKGDNINKAYALAEKVGVEFPRKALDQEAVPYTANKDEVRLALFIQALEDPEVEVLWALRGGYGSSRLLPELARRDFPKAKIFVGYSDMTFLHLFFQTRGWQTIHGSMFWELSGLSAEDDNFRILAELLSGKRKELVYDELTCFNTAAENAVLPLTGTLTGGNLTCVAAAVGTPWQLDAKGKILFLEDVKEGGYKIDRMLTQLQLAGQLEGLNAIIFGTFSKGDEQTEFSLTRFAEECKIPIFKADIFGHGPKNYPLVFNTPATLEKSDEEEDGITLRVGTYSFSP